MTVLMICLVALGLVLLFAPLLGDWLARRDTRRPAESDSEEGPPPGWFWTEWERDNER